jgi:hypothetical protein
MVGRPKMAREATNNLVLTPLYAVFLLYVPRLRRETQQTIVAVLGPTIIDQKYRAATFMPASLQSADIAG